jgi:hypothetical protein
MNRHFIILLLAGGIVWGCTTQARAQANDALLNKLVQKGYLTKEEADDLKKESEAGFEKSYRTRTGLPEWVTSLKFSGDLRGRAEGFWTRNDSAAADNFNNDRWRMRYRLRFGAVVTLKDNLELGFRLTSGEGVGSGGAFGGDPISANTTFQDNGSKKFIYVDQAYGKWTPFNYDQWKLSGTIGKMANPFETSTMLFDDDYTPEGVALQGLYNIHKQHALKFNAGFFVLDEIAQGEDSDNDPFLLGGQFRWDAKWSDRIDSSLGVAMFAIIDEQSLTNFSVPNVNAGNTRLANGALLHDYTPVIGEAAVGYTFDSGPFYKGKFPVRVLGTVMHNPGASDDNNGWEAALVVGKSGKKGTWEVSYRYRRLEADAWFEELTDSDLGAFYQVTPTSSGLGVGYRAGTNLKGHILRGSYSPFDAITFGVTYYLADLIHEPIVAMRHAESGMNRIQFDAVWKF